MNWQDNQYGGDYGYQPQMRVRFGPALSPIVMWLIIINAAVFIVDLLTAKWHWLDILAYNPYLAISRLYLWQFVTYMFMHANFWHIAVNMFALWMFGSEVERRIGVRSFLTVYLLCGIFGAALFTLSHIPGITTPSPVMLVGASGAVLGVLVAFAMIFPERRITLLVMFVFPVSMSAKTLVLGYFIITVLSELASLQQGIAHLAHLGGMVFAYFYMKFKYRLSLPFAFSEKIGLWFRMRFSRVKPVERRNKYEPIDSSRFISEEIDPILDKISKHGISSLTWRERRALKKARSRMK